MLQGVEGRIKLNFDVALNATDDRMGIGVAGREHNGKLLRARTRTTWEVDDPEKVKAKSVDYIVGLAMEHGWTIIP